MNYENVLTKKADAITALIGHKVGLSSFPKLTALGAGMGLGATTPDRLQTVLLNKANLSNLLPGLGSFRLAKMRKGLSKHVGGDTAAGASEMAGKYTSSGLVQLLASLGSAYGLGKGWLAPGTALKTMNTLPAILNGGDIVSTIAGLIRKARTDALQKSYLTNGINIAGNLLVPFVGSHNLARSAKKISRDFSSYTPQLEFKDMLLKSMKEFPLRGKKLMLLNIKRPVLLSIQQGKKAVDKTVNTAKNGIEQGMSNAKGKFTLLYNKLFGTGK